MTGRRAADSILGGLGGLGGFGGLDAAGREGLSTALTGQTAAFVAVLVPILGQRFGSVSLLAAASAVSAIASWLGSWGFTSVYPSVRTGPAARAAVATAAAGCALVVSALLVASLAVGPDGVRSLLRVGAVFTACQIAYLIAVGSLIRRGAIRSIGRARLLYGVSSLVLASVATLPGVPDIALPMGTAAAFLLAVSGILLAEPRHAAVLLASLVRVPVSSVLEHLASHWRAAIAGLLSNIGLQLSALIVLGSSEFREAWAVVLRISSGFGMVGVSVIGPRVQAQISRAVRRGDASAAARSNRHGLLGGSVLAALALGTLGTVFLVIGAPGAPSVQDWTVLLVALIPFVVTTVGVSPITANLVLMRRQPANLKLNVVRVAALLPAAFAPSPAVALLVLAVAESLVQLAYAEECVRSAQSLPVPVAADSSGPDSDRSGTI